MSSNVRILFVAAKDHEAEMALSALLGKRELTTRELKAFRKRAQHCRVLYSTSLPQEGDIK
jgi:hypothetical protein